MMMICEIFEDFKVWEISWKLCSPFVLWPGFPLSLNDGWCVHKTSSVDNFQQSFESFDRHSKWNKSENLWFSLVLLHCLNKQELQASSNPSTSYSTKATILVWIGLGWIGLISVSYIWPGGSNQHTDLKRVTHFEQEGQHGIKWDQKLVLGGLPQTYCAHKFSPLWRANQGGCLLNLFVVVSDAKLQYLHCKLD